MTPLVSVIVPAYNAEKYLAETIQSALAQTYPNIEIIIVNDGSNDETLNVANSFEGPQVKVIDQENRGAAAARNRGLEVAQGEFIQHLDADDLISADKIEIQVKRLTGMPNCIAACRWGRFYTNVSETKFVPEPFWQDLKPIDWLVSRWERSSMMHPAAWLVPRSIIERGGNWNESLSLDDDCDFFDRMVVCAEVVLFCNEVESYYRSGLPSSLSGTKSVTAWNSKLCVLNCGVERALNLENTHRVRRACSRGFEEFVYSAFPDVPELRSKAWNCVKSLGGPYFSPQMGKKMRVLSCIVGWKIAKRLVRLVK